MYALDFEYDNQYLSDFGFIVCDFNSSSGANTVEAGSKITFNTVPLHNGKIYGLSGTKYDSCIQASFAICKNPDIYDDLEISVDEYRDLVRWLNRNEFLRFQVLEERKSDREACYYDASFNINKIKINEILYGLELTMETNRPFGYGQERTISWNITDTAKTYILSDISDEIGSTYPKIEITCNANGDLSIHNEIEACTTTIKNCKNGERIVIDGERQTISSSLSSHDICDDFNYEFFRIGNTYESRINRISVNQPCVLKISYSPIIKDSP